MENIRKLVLLVMILGILPIAFIGTGIAAESDVVDVNVLSSTTLHGTDFLYIGDGVGDTVKQFDANTGNFIEIFVSSGSGGLLGPRGILFKKNGQLLVSNQHVNNSDPNFVDIPGDILKYNGKTGVFLTALANYTYTHAPWSPQGIVLKDSKLYVADLGDFTLDGIEIPGNVSVYDENNGKFLRNLTQNPTVSGIPNINFHPRALVFGPDGNLYVSVRSFPSPLGGSVLRFKSDGRFKDVFFNDTGGVGQLNRPQGLVFGPDGKLYITSFRADGSDTDSIRIYSANGVFLKKIDLDTVGQPRSYAQAIIFGPKGRLYVPITTTGEVRRYNVTDGTYDSFIKEGGELISPWFLTFGKTDPTTLEYRN